MRMPDDQDRDDVDDRELREIAAAVVDPAAFGPLYDRYALDVYRYCLRQVRDVDVANDLTSQIFIKILRGLGRFEGRPGQRFRAWVFTIAQNTLRDQWRTTRIHSRLEWHEANLRDVGRGPEERAVVQSEVDRMLDAVERLPPRQRSIVQFRLAGLSTQEIADAMGTTVAAVKSAQSRAYASLQSWLDEPGGTAP